MNTNNEQILLRIADKIDMRNKNLVKNKKHSYVAQLLSEGPDTFLKKIGEEATELVIAAKSGIKNQIIHEMADLWFHCLIVLTHYGLRPEDIFNQLGQREGTSGLTEKAQRSSES
ncbi:MAG: phosphoribosyl-ATP diphosphatase [Bordetella sp.]|nr:MAG: phosphoribosyl-ATP diphosphatase [Bordetella sp.]